MRRILFISLALVLISSIANAQSDTHLKQYPITSGSISSIIAGDTYSVLLGNFNEIGSYQGNGAVIDATTGTHDPTYPIFHGHVYDVIADGSGGWYVAGSSDVNNVLFQRLVHIKPDKTIDEPWAPNPNGSVYALALQGTTLYVGGLFTQIAGTPRNHLAAFDVTTGNLLPWDPDMPSGRIEKLNVSGGVVYVGGLFTTIGGQARKNIAAIDVSTGAVTAWNPTVDGINSSVLDIVPSGSLVYVSGFFTSAGGSSRRSLAALDVSTGLATSWNPNPNSGGAVAAMELNGSTMYIGGTFTTVGGLSREYLAEISISTGALTSWDPNFDDNIVYDLALSGTTLYVAGSFQTVNGLPNANLVAVSTSTGSLLSWDPNPDEWVTNMALYGNNLFVEGGDDSNFHFNWLASNDFAIINNTTGELHLTDLDTGGDLITYGVTSGNTVYISGTFTLVEGQPRQGLAAIDIPTGTLLPWAPTTNGQVSAIAVNNSSVYLGGNFSSVNSTSRDALAEVDATSGNLLSMNYNFNGGEVLSLYATNTILYAGGTFPAIDAEVRNNIGALDISTGSILSWDPASGGLQDIIKIEANSNWVVARNSLDKVIALEAVSANTSFEFPEDLSDFALADDILILCTNMTDPYGQNGLASFDLNTGSYTTWQPDIGTDPDGYPAASAVGVVGDKIFVGGFFIWMGFDSRESFGAYSVTAPVPLITFTTHPTDIASCSGASATLTIAATGTTNIIYQWQFSTTLTGTYNDIVNGGGYTNVTSASLSVNTTGNFGAGFYRCKVNGDLSATVFSSAAQLTVNANPSAPTVTGTSSCGTGSVTLSATGATAGQYRWYTVATGGTALTGEVNSLYATPILSATTTYYAAINDGTCESARTPATATINTAPAKPSITSSIAPVGGNVSVCSSNILTFMAPTGFSTYTWSTGASTQVITVSVSGSYTVTVTNSSGCASPASDVIAVTVIPAPCNNQAPVIALTEVTAVSEGSASVDLASLISDADNNLDLSSLKIIVQPSSGAPATIDLNSNLIVNYAGIAFSGADLLTIEVCDLLGDCSQQQITIDVIGDIIIYDGISPDGNDQNPIFYIQYIDVLADTKNNRVKIYNRWGDAVFETSNYDNVNRVFTGLSKNGNELPSGTYFYKIEFDSGQPSRTGYLTIKR